MNILAVLTHTGLCAANGEARRMVTQRAVKVDGELTTDISVDLIDGVYAVSVGKNREIFVRINNGAITSFHKRLRKEAF